MTTLVIIWIILEDHHKYPTYFETYFDVILFQKSQFQSFKKNPARPSKWYDKLQQKDNLFMINYLWNSEIEYDPLFLKLIKTFFVIHAKISRFE